MYKKILNKKNEVFHYYEYGSENSDTMLFLPGYADSALMYHKLGKSLAHKYRVVCLDFPMIHQADKIFTLETLTNFVAEFVVMLKIKNFTIAGFSACGLIAIRYTYLHQDKVNELILLNSSPRFILSGRLRNIFKALKPFFLLRLSLFLYSRLNTTKFIRKTFKSPKISRFTSTRMRSYYYSVFGTAYNLIGESVISEFNRIKISKKIIFFKDDTIIPWDKYQDFVEKLDCEVIVFSEGLHADKKIYWEKLKSIWLKSPKIEFQKVKIETGK